MNGLNVKLKKSKAQKGETYVEVLTSVLMLALAAVMLFTLISTAGKINNAARAADEAFYKSVSEVEDASGQTFDGSVHFEIEGEEDGQGEIDAELRSDNNGSFAAFSKKKA